MIEKRSRPELELQGLLRRLKSQGRMMRKQMKSRLLAGAAVAASGAVGVVGLSSAPAHAGTITMWNFDQQFNGTSVLPVTAVGVGSLGLYNNDGNTANLSQSSTGSIADTNSPNRALTFPQSPGTDANLARGAQFNVSTSGYTNISVSFDMIVEKNSSRFFQLYDTTDGSDWNPVSGGTGTNPTLGLNVSTGTIDNNGLITVVSTAAAASSGEYSTGFTYSFAPGAAEENNPLFGFRIMEIWDPIVSDGINGYVSSAYDQAYDPTSTNTSAYSPVSSVGGANYRSVVTFDDVTVSGSAVPEPASLSLLLPAAGLMLRRRTKR
jgi:hypothetical protein